VLRSKLIIYKHQTSCLALSINRRGEALRLQRDVFSAKGAMQASAWGIAPGIHGTQKTASAESAVHT
jgi:hypothetical protein